MSRGRSQRRTAFLFEDMIDRDYRKRAMIALACAIAIHEVAAGLFRAPFTERQAPEVRVYSITIARASPTPRPTPKPTAKPTMPPTPPPTPHPRATIALVTAPVHQASRHAAAPVRKTAGGGASVKHRSAVHATYVAAIAAGRHSGVAGTSRGAGAGTQPGNGGLAGNGSGVGNQGEFAGLPAADVPCGEPIFIGLRAHYVNGKFYEDVDVELQFKDGHTESGHMPYLFVYNSEAENPFSDQNKDKDAFLQQPPPGTDISGAPRVVQYVIRHSSADGRTLLPQCPTPPRG